ncbi:MAG: hypothetical protein ACTSRP_23835, partial [Candidatus Helarchaeota archaeon]
MNFLITNIPSSNLQKLNNIYIKGKYFQKGDHFLFLKTFYYPKREINVDKLLDKIIENGIEYISCLKGYFCGIYYNSEENILKFFTDKLGHYDLFYYKDEDQIIISDNFNEILKFKKFSKNDIDKEAIYEFIIFQYPLFEKTFIKKVKFVPIGTIYSFDLEDKILNEFTYFDYIFNINEYLDKDTFIENLEVLFKKAIQRIKRIFSFDTIFGLGLSGGMDSRLTAYFFVKYG